MRRVAICLYKGWSLVAVHVEEHVADVIFRLDDDDRVAALEVLDAHLLQVLQMHFLFLLVLLGLGLLLGLVLGVGLDEDDEGPAFVRDEEVGHEGELQVGGDHLYDSPVFAEVVPQLIAEPISQVVLAV